MSSIPEGTETATGEGRDLSSAVAAAAESLGVKKHQVNHKLDMSHFRSSEGRSTARDTVKVIAWVNPDAPEEAPPEPVRQPRPERSDDDRGSRGRDREDRGGRGRDRDGDREDRGRGRGRDREDRGGRGRDRDGDREDRGRGRGRDREEREERPRRAKSDEPMGEPTEASEFAKAWFITLLEALRVEGTVEAAGTEDRVHIRIKPTSKAGRLIGRRGSTLAAIRHLLGLAVEKYGEFVIDVDVDDDREDRKPRDRDRDDRGRGRGRDRDDRGGRGRDRDDRGGRGRGRGRRDDDRGEREKSAYPEEKLRALARRAAEKAVETQKTITINLDLNSYDRRLVHLEVSECEGVQTQSVEKDGKKVVQVIPD